MVSRRIVLKFPHQLVDQPIVYKLVKDYNLEFNILKAYVTPREEGLLVLDLKGEEDKYQQGMGYLRSLGIGIQPLSKDIRRNEAKCTHCGACVVICPSNALAMDIVTRKVLFYEDKCIACELCINACPPRAMEIHF